MRLGTEAGGPGRRLLQGSELEAYQTMNWSRGLESIFLAMPHPAIAGESIPALLSPYPFSRLYCSVICQSNVYTALLNMCSFKFGQHYNLVLTSLRSHRVKKRESEKERLTLLTWVGLIQSGEGFRAKSASSQRRSSASRL